MQQNIKIINCDTYKLLMEHEGATVIKPRMRAHACYVKRVKIDENNLKSMLMIIKTFTV